MKTDSVVEVMTKNVVCVTPDQYILDVKHIYEKKDFHHHIPVEEDGKLVGMVSLVDFMYNIAGAGIRDDSPVYKEFKVKDIMTQDPFFMNTSTSIEDVAKVLMEGRYRAIPILEDKKIVGIVSTADVIKHFLNQAH